LHGLRTWIDSELAVKRLIALTCLATTFIWPVANASQRLAFERNGSVYIANLEASLIRKLTDGIFPAISPDGKSVAFTQVEPKDGTYVRRIAIVENATGGSRRLDSVPSENSYCPTWSRAGDWIGFTMRSNEVWDLGIVKVDGSGFTVVGKGEPKDVTLFSPCWARDGKSIFCQDMIRIYQLDLNGSVIAQWTIEKIVPNGSMSGDGRIDVSPDGNRLLLSVEMNEEYDRKDWDGPVPALWSLDLTTHAAVRLTSKNLFAWDGCWIDDANLLFVSQRTGDKRPAIYRTNGRNVKRLIEDAHRPSVSR
jgi:TolB protein